MKRWSLSRQESIKPFMASLQVCSVFGFSKSGVQRGGAQEMEWRSFHERSQLLQRQQAHPSILVGVACGSCHIAPNPSNPPLDAEFRAGKI